MDDLTWAQMPNFFPGQEVWGASDQRFQFIVVYEPKMGSRPWSWSYKRLPVPNKSSAIRMGDGRNMNEVKRAVEQFRAEHSE